MVCVAGKKGNGEEMRDGIVGGGGGPLRPPGPATATLVLRNMIRMVKYCPVNYANVMMIVVMV